MQRDHMMGFPSVAEAAAAVADEGEFYAANYFFDDPHPLGYPSSRREMHEARRAGCLKEARAVVSFERGNHLPDGDVLDRAYEGEAKRRAADRARVVLAAPAVTPEPAPARRPVEVRTALPQVPALFKPNPLHPAQESPDATVKRWDVLHAAQEKRREDERNRNISALLQSQGFIGPADIARMQESMHASPAQSIGDLFAVYQVQSHCAPVGATLALRVVTDPADGVTVVADPDADDRCPF